MQIKLTSESVTTFLKIKEISSMSFNAIIKQALDSLLEKYEQQGVKSDYNKNNTTT